MTYILILMLLPTALIGAFVLTKTIILPMKKPADTSNRIAHLTLVWEALNRPENFVEAKPREYLKHDLF
jgi:hypothetical protein